MSDRTKFHWFRGDVNWLEHGGVWISSRKVASSGNWGYYIRELWYRAEEVNDYEKALYAYEVLTNHEKTKPVGERRSHTRPERPERYEVSLTWVSPPLAGHNMIETALNCLGIKKPWDELTEHEQVETLYSSYGGNGGFACGRLHTIIGNNYRALFSELNTWVS